MTIVSVVQQIVQQLQFITLLQSLNVNWPSDWLNFTGVFSFFNLDIEYFLGQQDIPVIDFRSLFILISIAVPIALNLILLLVFQPFLVVLWYLCLCSGAVLLVAGFFAQILPGGAANALTFIIVGASLLGAALLALLVKVIIEKCKKDQESEEVKFEQERKYELRFHRKRSLLHLAVFLVFGLAGVICLRVFVLTIPNADTSVLKEPAFAIVGFVCFGIAGIALIVLLLSLCAAGRKFMSKVKAFLKNNLLMVMLMLISMSYIPTITYAMTQFLCADYQCPVGYKFNPFAQRDLNDYDTSPKRYCDRCVVLHNPSNVSVGQLCPNFLSSRAWKHPDIPCDESAYFFFVAAAIVLICYLGGMPFVYVTVIRYLTDHIPEKADIGSLDDEADDDEVWGMQMQAIAPVARSLYEPYRLPRRYFLLVSMVHRTLTTIALSIAAPYSSAAAALILFIHGAACLFVLTFKPYLDTAEQFLAAGLAIGNMANGIFAVIVWQQGSTSTPTWITGLFIAVNVVFPVAASIIGIVLKRKKDQERAERVKRNLEAAAAHDAHVRATREARRAAGMRSETPQPETHDPSAPVVLVDGAAPPAAAAAPPRRTPPPAASRGTTPLPEGVAVAPAQDEDDDEEELVQREEGAAAGGADGVGPRELTPEEQAALKRRKNRNKLQTDIVNAESTKVLNMAFSALGLFFFFAAAVAALGYLRQPEAQYIPGNNAVYSTTKYSLGGYSNWTDFTANCACIQQSSPSFRFNVSERWICSSGKVVERGRVTLDGRDNALPIRKLCAKDFESGCDISVANSRVKVTCSPTPAGVSYTAITYLW